MKRRILLISIVLALLLLSSFIGAQARDLALTATMSATPSPVTFPQADFVAAPLSGTAPLTVQFTPLYTTTGSPILGCSWTFGDGTTQFVSGSFSTCPPISHVYTAGGSFNVQLSVQITDMIFTAIKTNYIQVGAPPVTVTPTPPSGQPDLLYPSAPNWIWDPNAYDSANNCYNYTPVLVWNVQVRNAGSADAGSFVVSQNYDRQQTVSGLPAGQTSTLYFPFPGWPVATAMPGQPTLSAMYSNFHADYTNLVNESNETNNTTRSGVPVFTATPNGGPTRVYCKTATPVVTFTPTRTSTSGPTLTRTRTPTTGPTATRTRTATAGPSLTLTRTLTPTPFSTACDTPSSCVTGTPATKTPTATPTVVLGICSPVTSVITAPFSFDGAGMFCWQSSNLGAYINSWNTTTVTINGVVITNAYVPASSYPAKIGGYWYVGYSSSVAWGHFEAK